jgi:hypothetical protein
LLVSELASSIQPNLLSICGALMKAIDLMAKFIRAHS